VRTFACGCQLTSTAGVLTNLVGCRSVCAVGAGEAVEAVTLPAVLEAEPAGQHPAPEQVPVGQALQQFVTQLLVGQQKEGATWLVVGQQPAVPHAPVEQGDVGQQIVGAKDVVCGQNDVVWLPAKAQVFPPP